MKLTFKLSNKCIRCGASTSDTWCVTCMNLVVTGN